MTEDEWDSVVRVHLKGHFAPAHFAANYWREQTKSGREINAAIVNTTSTSGLFSNPGQANYDAAKSGIATLTQVMAKELVRYGVRGERDRARRAHAPHAVDAGSRRGHGGARRRFVRRSGRRRTCRRSSRTSAPPTARSPARRSSCAAGTCNGCRPGRSPRRSSRTTAGRSPSWRARAGELTSRIPLEEGGMGAPQYRFD